MVDPALAALLRETQRKTDTPNGVAVAAARDILDRAGLAAAPPEQASAGATFQLVVINAGGQLEIAQPARDVSAELIEA